MEHTAYHRPIDIDARDSDRMELPDAPDASRWNVPMAIVAAPFVAIVVGLVLAVVTR